MSDKADKPSPPAHETVVTETGLAKWRCSVDYTTVSDRPGGKFIAVFADFKEVARFELTEAQCAAFARLLTERPPAKQNDPYDKAELKP